jgi:hypothetical protein
MSVNWRFGGKYRLHQQSQKNKFSKKPAWKQVPPGWRRYVPPKRRLTLNRLNGVISQKTVLSITIAVRTSNPTPFFYCCVRIRCRGKYTALYPRRLYCSTEELLDASFSMRSVSYLRTVGDYFFPEFLFFLNEFKLLPHYAAYIPEDSILYNHRCDVLRFDTVMYLMGWCPDRIMPSVFYFGH